MPAMRLSKIVAGLLLAAWIAAAAAQGPALRPEVGKPIQAAIDALKQKRGKEALAKAREAQAVPNKTAYESYMVERVIGQAAAAAGEHGTAARALEQAANSSAAPEGERRQILAAAANLYYSIKEYGKAGELASRYMKEGGSDKAVRTIYTQSLYLSGNLPAAAKAIAADIDHEEQGGRAPSEEQLQLLANVYDKQKDTNGYSRAMEKLVAYYPKKDYWQSVIYGVTTRPGYSDRLAIEIARLKLATGTMRTVEEYVESAQLSLQEGFPIEANKIIDQGYSAGLLGTGPDAGRHKRLKDLATKSLAEDQASAAKDAGPAKDGKSLFNEGFNLVLNGKSDKGLEMMEQGLKLNTGFRRIDHAKLQMGYAYYLAGQKQKAQQAYKRVQGDDGALTLARLWIIRLAQASQRAGSARRFSEPLFVLRGKLLVRLVMRDARDPHALPGLDAPVRILDLALPVLIGELQVPLLVHFEKELRARAAEQVQLAVDDLEVLRLAAERDRVDQPVGAPAAVLRREFRRVRDKEAPVVLARKAVRDALIVGLDLGLAGHRLADREIRDGVVALQHQARVGAVGDDVHRAATGEEKSGEQERESASHVMVRSGARQNPCAGMSSAALNLADMV